MAMKPTKLEDLAKWFTAREAISPDATPGKPRTPAQQASVRKAAEASAAKRRGSKGFTV